MADEQKAQVEAGANGVDGGTEATSTESYEPDLLAADAGEHPPVDEEQTAEDDERGTDEDEEIVEETVVVVRRSMFFACIAAAVLVIAALAGALVYELTKPASAVAKVNGASISRKSYDEAVAHDNGPTVLDDLVTNKLLQQDAAKKHVTVTTDEVDAKLKEAKANFPTDAEYQQALQQNHLTELQLRDRIRNNILLQKLTADKTQVTDQDVQQEFNKNKDTLYQGKTLADVQDSIKQQLTQQKQQDATSAYLKSLCDAANITTHLPGGDTGHGCPSTLGAGGTG